MSPRRLASSGIDTDDYSAFDRPRRRSRPRTKNRPDYSDLPIGQVTSIDRGRYTCRLDDHDLVAMKARSLGRKAVIVGDRVRLDGDTSGAEGSLARIPQVERRRTVLRRTADDTDPHERAIVANADQIFIVTALAQPEPRVGMIDRVLVAAYDAGVDPVLCLTKADLADPDELMGLYGSLDVPVVTTRPGADLDPVRDMLTDRTTVLVGHSGVGKSTLMNALVPGAGRTTGHVNDATGRGRHTSTSAQALELPGGGWIIDTPGVRSFGLSHVTADRILAAFGDLEPITAQCPRGCEHLTSSPECALDRAVEHGLIRPIRLESFRRLDADRQADGGVAVPDTGTTGMGQPGARHRHMARHRDHLARVGSVDRSGLR